MWDSVADAGRRAIKMRYQLLPHLYTAFHQAHKQGTPVAKPVWFAYPEDPATHGIDDQWLLGDVLITPVLHQVSTLRYQVRYVVRGYLGLNPRHVRDQRPWQVCGAQWSLH